MHHDDRAALAAGCRLGKQALGRAVAVRRVIGDHLRFDARIVRLHLLCQSIVGQHHLDEGCARDACGGIFRGTLDELAAVDLAVAILVVEVKKTLIEILRGLSRADVHVHVALPQSPWWTVTQICTGRDEGQEGARNREAARKLTFAKQQRHCCEKGRVACENSLLHWLCWLSASQLPSPTKVADFYRGKQVQIVIGYGSGGGYDLNARMLARHLSPFIPGNPTIVPQNMPGAGSLRAANYVLDRRPKGRDGHRRGRPAGVAVTALLGGNPAVKFTPADINWIGTLSSYENDAFILWLRKDAAAKSAEDLLRPGGPEASVGGSAIGSYGRRDRHHPARCRKDEPQARQGYPDGNSISLALERGEVHGRRRGPEFDFRHEATMAVARRSCAPDHPGRPRHTAPAIQGRAHGARSHQGSARRAIIEAMEQTYQLARPYIAAQGIPQPRLAALRKGSLKLRTAKGCGMKPPR